MVSDISKGTGTKFSRYAIILAIVMIVNVVIIILLTPIGFETRPQSALEDFRLHRDYYYFCRSRTGLDVNCPSVQES